VFFSCRKLFHPEGTYPSRFHTHSIKHTAAIFVTSARREPLIFVNAKADFIKLLLFCHSAICKLILISALIKILAGIYNFLN